MVSPPQIISIAYLNWAELVFPIYVTSIGCVFKRSGMARSTDDGYSRTFKYDEGNRERLQYRQGG